MKTLLRLVELLAEIPFYNISPEEERVLTMPGISRIQFNITNIVC